MSSNAFFDVTCECGKFFGWFGTMMNRPPCPSCGDRPPDDELQAAQARIDEIGKPLDAESKQIGKEARRKRLDAGLNLRQAARMLEISITALSAYESGRERLPASMIELMNRLY